MTTRSTSGSSGSVEKEEEVSITDDVRGAEYYHGLIPRADAEPMLKKDGDYLLRKTEAKAGLIIVALSVRAETGVKHFMINQDKDGTFYFEDHHEKNISELIQFHQSKGVPLSVKSGVKILRAIERSPWMLNHDAFLFVKKLGEGAFGEVFLAEFLTKQKLEVAVKTMRTEATRDARLRFMKEARLMRKYSHKNVVNILGVAVHEHPLLLVMEFCPNGSLVGYLRKNRGRIEQQDKLRFALEASEGLAYLESKQCIHRDIAARNCLLSAKNEVKIADFGMSEDRVVIQDDTLDKVPVKWLAPETLQEKVYTLKTDVWSYGIMVWEIYADGAEPYPGLTRLQTRAKIIVQNYRMDMPKETPRRVAEIIAMCWEKDPRQRPEMSRVRRMLSEVHL